MNIKISRILYLLLIVFTAAIFIPEFYWMKFEKNIIHPMVYYSAVNNEILTTRLGNKDLIRANTHGKSYTREQFEQLMPFMNYRQLVVDNKMPDSLKGVKIVVDKVRINNFWLRIFPGDLDFNPIALYPMFESKSGRVRLEMPDDYFRITGRLEFIKCATNQVDEKKSELFTEKLLMQNFAFPAVMISGNPNPKKPFDEGYFVLDSKNALFQIKMVKGKPFCVNTNIPDSLDITFMKISEMPLREFYGYIFTRSGEVYLISYDNYKLIKLPLTAYDIKKEAFSIAGDLFNRTITLTGPDKLRTVVTDRNYKVINNYEESWKNNDSLNAGIAAAYIFPFTISLTDNSSSYSNIFIRFSDNRFIYASVFFAAVSFFILKRRDISFKKGWFDILFVLLTGIFGFIAILLVKNIDSIKNE